MEFNFLVDCSRLGVTVTGIVSPAADRMIHTPNETLVPAVTSKAVFLSLIANCVYRTQNEVSKFRYVEQSTELHARIG